MRVEDVMDRQPPLCFRGQDLIEAARTIHDLDAPGAPVFDLGFRLVGVLSLDDLVKWEARRSSARSWLRTMEERSLVAHVMTHDIVGVSAHESISDAARIMRYVARSLLPVLNEDGSLAGTISHRDIAGAVARSDMSIRDEVRHVTMNGATATGSAPLDVRVEAGTVTLTGVVESRRTLTQLQQDVASITGVTSIDSQDVASVRRVRSTT